MNSPDLARMSGAVCQRVQESTYSLFSVFFFKRTFTCAFSSRGNGSKRATGRHRSQRREPHLPSWEQVAQRHGRPQPFAQEAMSYVSRVAVAVKAWDRRRSAVKTRGRSRMSAEKRRPSLGTTRSHACPRGLRGQRVTFPHQWRGRGPGLRVTEARLPVSLFCAGEDGSREPVSGPPACARRLGRAGRTVPAIRPHAGLPLRAGEGGTRRSRLRQRGRRHEGDGELLRKTEAVLAMISDDKK